MVALVENPAPTKRPSPAKNRAPDFFAAPPDRTGVSGFATRTVAGKNARFSYNACRGVSLAQGEDNGFSGPFEVGDRYRTVRGGSPVSPGSFGSTLDEAQDFGFNLLQTSGDLAYRAANLAEFFVYETWAQANGVVGIGTGFYSDVSMTYRFTEATAQLNIMGSELMGTQYQAVGVPLLLIDAGANYLEALGPSNEWNYEFFHEQALDSLNEVRSGSGQ